MAKSKVKRYAKEGYVYEDDTPEEVANRSAESQAIMDEAKGESMLKSMRDEAVKPKVVTKEELAKSGLSLRDYLNKQQGLTRRGESSTSAPAAKSTTSTSLTTQTSKSEPKVGRAGQATGASSGLSFQDRQAMEYLQKKKEADRSTSSFGSSQRSRKYTTGMASGGSASSRADGIAKRGKTRGKIC